jgi:hypothetical protein
MSHEGQGPSAMEYLGLGMGRTSGSRGSYCEEPWSLCRDGRVHGDSVV